MQSQLKIQKPFFKDINTLKKVYGKAKNWELNTTLKGKNKLENSHCQISESYYKSYSNYDTGIREYLPKLQWYFSINQQSHISPQSTVSPPWSPQTSLPHFSIFTLFLSLDHFKCSFPISMKCHQPPPKPASLCRHSHAVQSSTHFFDHRIASQTANSRFVHRKNPDTSCRVFLKIPPGELHGLSWQCDTPSEQLKETSKQKGHFTRMQAGTYHTKINV